LDRLAIHFLSAMQHSGAGLDLWCGWAGSDGRQNSALKKEKGKLGMDYYEVRKYLGWNHQMLTGMRSHFFLWHLKNKLGKSTGGYYHPA